MPQCAVISCNNTHRKTKGGSVRYHRFPGDAGTRARWVRACGRHVHNCSTARVCSRHFSDESYERDVQHELLGLPTRCRLRKGAVPDANLPEAVGSPGLEDADMRSADSAIAVLLAVGLVPAAQTAERTNGGLPRDLNKMHVMDEVREGCDAQPSSPGHAEQRAENVEDEEQQPPNKENGISQPQPEEAKSDTIKDEVNNLKPDDVKEEEEEKPVTKSDDTPNDVAAQDADQEIDANHLIEEESSNDEEIEENVKRKMPTKSELGSASKRLKADLESNFALRDKLLQQYIEAMGCGGSLDQIHVQTEQLLAEIRTLHELAREKENEWNNIIHMKKMKEELLLRLQRHKQVLLLGGDKGEMLDMDLGDGNADFHEERQQSLLKPKMLNAQRHVLKAHYSKHQQQQHQQHQQRGFFSKSGFQELNGQGQNKQRNVVDVQSIIADYRQRHPETVPRRGRRIRSVLSSGNTVENGSKMGVLNFASMALGSGAQVRQNVNIDANNDLGMLINPMDASERQEERHPSHGGKGAGFPEVTVHPVTTPPPQPTNSLLHGILTKAQSKTDSKTTFSPTLARLLTAPERASGVINAGNPNVSISDILSGSKARNEITITPVGNQFEATGAKAKNQDEEEADDSADRLVIDEGGDVIDARTSRADTGSDAGDEVPQCQGCNQKAAQFVCAGCGNQWYCSRECQVSAWDEHSEVCSG